METELIKRVPARIYISQDLKTDSKHTIEHDPFRLATAINMHYRPHVAGFLLQFPYRGLFICLPFVYESGWDFNAHFPNRRPELFL